jgi:ubiquinone/menaquinone biosynthesis C-methylase UbiE
MEAKKIEKLIKKAQRVLKLSSYKIRYNIIEADPSEYAEISCQHPKRTATIDFNRERIHQELENTVIHELLHLLFFKVLLQISCYKQRHF